jgi:hypothetical protein
MSNNQKRAEEARRERHWDARRRWQVLQETMTWAEAQSTVRRNTRAACLAQQARQNARRHAAE